MQKFSRLTRHICSKNTTDPSRWMRGPLFRAACSTTNFRAARPRHFTRAVVRREDQARAAASQPSVSRRACSRAPDAPRSGCVGHSVSRNPPSRPSLLSTTTTSACVGGNDLCTQSEFHGQQLRFGQRMPRHSHTMLFTSRHCEK